MLWRQYLRAAVDEPGHVGWVIRHADADVVDACAPHLQPQCAAPVLHRDVARQVNVLGTNDVGVLQLAH